MTLVTGGRPFYGESIGILMLDSRFPRIPGDVGNATTFSFPVRYQVVHGASPSRVVLERDPSLLTPFVEAAQQLAGEGVRAITTSCGFLALYQREMAGAVDIPVFTSSLLQAPLVSRMLRPDQCIGILTAHGETLEPRYLRAVGIDESVPVVVQGSQDTPAFYETFVKNGLTLDIEAAEAGVVKMATDLLARHPNVGAFVCEGTNFSSFGPAVQEATGLPFFDIVTLTRWVHEAVVRRRVPGGFL
ncbi:MAG: aspartate/glutamate racemase family protein [Chloroflexi bacterium]|nr:aspartate/glutamate racemase family protein [Chloroflexota bacterium]